jgi:hypothetical protein
MMPKTKTECVMRRPGSGGIVDGRPERMRCRNSPNSWPYMVMAVGLPTASVWPVLRVIFFRIEVVCDARKQFDSPRFRVCVAPSLSRKLLNVR